MGWKLVTPTEPQNGAKRVVLAGKKGIIGLMLWRWCDGDQDRFSVEGEDSDDPPTHYLQLPEIPE